MMRAPDECTRYRRVAAEKPSQMRRKLGFFVFSHARVRPLTYREPMGLETMPSRSKPQAQKKFVVRNSVRNCAQ